MTVPTVYVETSCWGSLPRGQPQDRKRAVKRLLQMLDGARGLCVISEIVLAEIKLAPAGEVEVIVKCMDSLQMAIHSSTTEAEALARAYIDAGVLSEKRHVDALHVALATCLECSYLVSWNHRHLTRPRKILQYTAVNQLSGYMNTPLICNPLEACDELRSR